MSVEAPGRRGSGYLIAGRLVLTSAEVAPAVGEPVTIVPVSSGRSFPGVVTWRGTPGALVRVDDPGWSDVSDPAPVFGRVATARAGLPGETWGSASRERVAGSVSFEADRLVLSAPDEPAAGAAVFCHGLLVGVVADGGPGLLEVAPVAGLSREPGFLEAAGRAIPRLAPVELAAAQLTEPDQPRSPATLLSAAAEVVGFRGRQQLIDELGAWCSGAGFATLLLHGPAGQGKSRLGHELAGRLTAAGWATLWLDEAAPTDALAVLADVVVPLLVVVDTAETRPDQLRALLQACAGHDGTRPLRVLLLARTAGDWWRLLRTDPAAERLLDGASVVELPVLDEDPAGRADAYRQAIQDLAGTLPHVPGYAVHNWASVAARLTAEPHDAGGEALTVQTTALADLLDAMWPGPAADGRKTAEDRVLAHEQRYWSFTAAWHGLDVAEPALQDVLAAAFLFSPTDSEQAYRFLGAVADQDRRNTLRAWLADLYPGTNGRPWGTLPPDRLAERFAGLRLARSPGLPEPLIPVATDRQLRRMLAVYARHPGLAERLVDLCVRHADRLTPAIVATATSIDTPEPLLAALQRISADPDTDVERLALIGDGLPRLSPLAVEIAQRVTDRHRQSGRAAELATALNNLSIRLGDLGHNGPALAAIEEAVMIHRQLAGERPETFEADLARSLGNLSVRLGELEQPEPGLAAAEEATGIYRRLATRQPDTFVPDLASALMNLSLSLGALEQFPAGLAAIEESVDLYGQLATHRPDTYLPDLAAALSVLGISLGSLDRDEPSRAVAEEAVTIRRQLVAQRPDAFLPGLATALTDLAVRHVVLGERESALAAIEEALAIRHQLVERSPAAFGEDLEWSLHVHKVILESAAPE
ncbi:hypothetical protein L3i22_073210 [Actinoplanes sp. L3-i22]|nr:hypothetical protein L3i22_073210 [Actinoplanes sp. L3-i22]